MYKDPYAHLYQKIEGFKIKILMPNDEVETGYLSLEPSTRSTYDIAMRDATIDGLITMDNIEKLKPSQIFYKETNPNELYILQSVNEFEFQKITRNVNAIKQNCYTTIERNLYDEELGEYKYKTIYKDLISFVTMANKDEKNFGAGIEDTTNINIQIPKRNRNKELNVLENGDRIILTNLTNELIRYVKIESIDEFGVPGVIRIYGTYETRTGD